VYTFRVLRRIILACLAALLVAAGVGSASAQQATATGPANQAFVDPAATNLALWQIIDVQVPQ
jgi:hypothetical protein